MAERTLPKRKLVVIEEGTITSMASNDTFKKEFPFLASLATKTANKRGGCGGSGRGPAGRPDPVPAGQPAPGRVHSGQASSRRDGFGQEATAQGVAQRSPGPNHLQEQQRKVDATDLLVPASTHFPHQVQ